MGRRDDQRKIKLTVLSKINKHKELLFGSFSGRLTKVDKRRGWAGVTECARAAGVRGAAGDNPNYMRDIWWQNAKKTTMEKLDMAKEPGGAELVARKWNEFDDAVLQIVGREAPCMDVAGAGSAAGRACGPDEAAAEGDESDLPDDPLLQGDDESDLSVKKECMSHEPAEPRPSASSTKNSWSRIKAKRRETSEDRALGMSKVELEMELLRLQVYKTRLEARQLEAALRLPPCSLTADVAARAAPPPDDDSCDSFT